MKKFITTLVITTLALSFLITPSVTAAVNDDTQKIVEGFKIIEETNDNITYEIEEDGEKLRYEEKTLKNKNKSIVKTKVYKYQDEKLKLIDNYKTELNYDDRNVEVVQNKGNKKGKIEISLDKEEKAVATNMVQLAATSWTQTRFPGLSMGYRHDFSDGTGDARYSTMREWNVDLPNQDFDRFTREIDSMRSREGSFIYDATFIGAAQTLIDVVRGKLSLSWGVAWDIMRKSAVPLNVGYSMYKWIMDYDDAVNAFYGIRPGSSDSVKY